MTVNVIFMLIILTDTGLWLMNYISIGRFPLNGKDLNLATII